MQDFELLGMVVTGKPLSPDRGFVVSKAISCYNQSMYKYNVLRSSPIAFWQLDDPTPFDERSGFDYAGTCSATPGSSVPLVNGAKYSALLDRAAVGSFDCPVFKKGQERRPFSLESWVLPTPQSYDQTAQEYRENLAHKPFPDNANEPETKTFAVQGGYWGGESTRTIINTGGPFNRPFMRKTITSTAHATTNGIFSIGANPDVASPIGIGSRGTPILPNTTYTISMYVRYSTGDVTDRLSYQFADANGVKIGGLTPGPTTPLTTNKWSRLSVTFTTPANAAVVMLRTVGGSGVASVIGSTFDATGIMVTIGSELQPYADGNTPGWEWSGTPGASTSKTRSNVSKINLSPNPSTEVNIVGHYSSPGPNGVVQGSRVTTGGLFGPSLYRISWTTGTTTTGGGLYQQFDAAYDLPYSASAYIRSSKNQKFRAAIEWKDTEGANISISQNNPEDFVANTWKRISITGTPPLGAVRGVVSFFAGNGGTSWSAGDSVDYDGILIEQSAIVGDFYDGNSPDVIWSGAAGYSPSLSLVSTSKQQILSHSGRFDGLSIDGKTISFKMEFANQPPVEVTHDLVESQLAHVVGSFNGNMIELWVNGKAVASMPLTEEQKFDSYLDSDGKLYSGYTESSQRLAINSIAVYNIITPEDIERNYRAGIETIGQARIPVQKSGIPIELNSDAGSVFHEETWESAEDFKRGLSNNVQYTDEFISPTIIDGVSTPGSWSFGIPLDASADQSIYGVALSWSGTGVIVETSIDGANWFAAKSGELVNSISPGMNPTDKDLEVMVSFVGGITEDASRLDSITVVGYRNSTIANSTLNPVTLTHPALVRKDSEMNLFRDDNGVFLGGGSLSIGPDPSTVEPDPVRTIELWIKPRSGEASISGLTGTRYRNGSADSPLPVGEWSLVHLVSPTDITSDVVISGDAIVGQIALYDLGLTAGDISHIWKSYTGTTSIRIDETDVINITEVAGNPVSTYSHDWSISQAG